jgi:uncharacterized membrane protein HdeD (DUF308 family)
MPLPDEIRRMWGWFLALGILWIILGFIALGMDVFVTLTTVLFFGILLLTGGVFQVIHAFVARAGGGFFLHLLTGLFYVLVGVLIIIDPLGAALGLTLVLAAFFLASGITRLVVAFQVGHPRRRTYLVINGLLNLLLGGLIGIRWPGDSPVIIGLFVAIDLIFGGVALTSFALALRSRSAGGAEGTP